MAKVLVIGGGGREHALVWKLNQSPQVKQVFVAPGNGGTESIATNIDLGVDDVEGLLEFAQKEKIDLAVIGQEAASEAGVVDAFEKSGLLVFGPNKAAVRIESSKAFAKDLMKSENIPTADYQTFDDARQAKAYLKNKKFPIVIKASGLAEGKGVTICSDLAEATKAINDVMVNKKFGKAGNKVVIEVFLSGQEASMHALCDGTDAFIFPPSQDHKQVYDNDKGPNTGGMGVIAPLSWVSDKQIDFIKTNIVNPALKGLRKKNAAFKGCLYPGLMINGDNINVIEFNARFGDPEAEAYMRLLEGDLYEILKSCAKGKLDSSQLYWRSGVVIVVALASGGYPEKYEKGLLISGTEEAEKNRDIVVFHAGTKKDTDGYKTNGGRVLYVTATGNSIEDARTKAYKAVDCINFDGMHYRKDIGLRQHI